MIILLIMLILIFQILNNNISKDDIKDIRKIFIIALFFQLILFFIYQFDLAMVGRDVYYSDAEYYWEATKTILNGGQSLSYNRLYYTFCAIIQLLSPFVWVGWNNLFNILCVDMCAALATTIIYKKNKTNVMYFLYFVLFNPLIYYSLMRNLKDAMFILLVFSLGYLLNKTIENKKNYWIFIIIDVLTIPLFYNIRPWAFIISLFPILILMFNQRKQILKYKIPIFFIALFLISFVLLFFGKTIILNIQIWAPIVWNSFITRGIMSNLLGLGKLFIGPGFIRALFGHEYFEHYLILGNYMTAFGSLLWLATISFLLVMIKEPIKKIIKSSSFTKYLILFFISYVLIYTMQYGGSSEIRIRGVLYLTVYSLFFTTFEYKMTEKKTLISLILFMGIFTLSVVFG